MSNGGLFKEKFKIDSTRILDKDYATPGKYFVTICTGNRKLLFGKVVLEKTNLNQVGKIAEIFWQNIPVHFRNIKLWEYVIMPNHIHGIIEIMDDYFDEICRDAPRRVSTDVPMINFDFRNKFGPLNKNSLSSIINHYKGNVKRWCNRNGYLYFSWQSGFHEHIIKNEESLENIIFYIRNNPLFWYRDRNNPINFNQQNEK